MFLIAQKKRPDALNGTQTNPAFYNILFLKKSRKASKNDHLLGRFGYKWVFYEVFLDISETVLCKALGF